MRPGGTLRDARRWAALLAAVWLGLLLAVAGLATPAPFALLAKADAGRVAARILAQEAALSLTLGALLLVLQRVLAKRRQAAGEGTSGFDLAFGLTAAAVFCTIAGYYAILPMMEAARAGQGRLGFGQLHGISAAFYALKTVLVALLAWRLSRPVSSSG